MLTTCPELLPYGALAGSRTRDRIHTCLAVQLLLNQNYICSSRRQSVNVTFGIIMQCFCSLIFWYTFFIFVSSEQTHKVIFHVKSKNTELAFYVLECVEHFQTAHMFVSNASVYKVIRTAHINVI